MNDNKSFSVDHKVKSRKLFRLKNKKEKYVDKLEEIDKAIVEEEHNIRVIPTINTADSINNQMPKMTVKPTIQTVDTKNKIETNSSSKETVLTNIAKTKEQIELEKQKEINEANRKLEQERLLSIQEANLKANMKIEAVDEVVKSNKDNSVEQVLNEQEQQLAKQALLAKKNKVGVNEKKSFRYVAKKPNGEIIKGYFIAFLQEEVEAYLKNEKYEIISVKVKKDFNVSLGGEKLTYSELSFMMTQLSTYLRAGIPLIDSVRILERQSTKRIRKKLYAGIGYELTKGETFSAALAKQKNVFPKLLINMIKTAELTGDLPGVLDDMTDYYDSLDRTRKAMISALTYPLIIFVFSLVVVSFILIYVVPKFVNMFNDANAEIPSITKFIVAVSAFLQANILWVLLGIIGVLLLYMLLFKGVKGFRKVMQTILMKIPVIGKLIIYKEVTTFTKTFASLLNHNVFITQSMDILGTISENEVYKEIIEGSLEYLAKGSRISESFKGKWAFPIVAYEMLVTGENTGQLGRMMEYVADYYGDLHFNSVKRLNAFIEPIMIIFLGISVGFILLAIMIPMFSFYSQVGGA